MIVVRHVFFNKLGLLKEGWNFKASLTDKKKFSITNVVVEEFDHYITIDMSQEGALMHQE